MAERYAQLSPGRVVVCVGFEHAAARIDHALEGVARLPDGRALPGPLQLLPVGRAEEIHTVAVRRALALPRPAATVGCFEVLEAHEKES